MNRKNSLVFGVLCALLSWKNASFAQQKNYDPNYLPNTYRSASNPNYWKNKMPYPGYWQQDVYYQIEAEIDDSLDVIKGNSFKLTYWNNSPHTLDELYFHLYQNAFQPHSHYHALFEGNNKPVHFGEKYEKDGLGTTCSHVKVNGVAVDTSIHNTMMKVKLNEPLKSGDSVVVTMKFGTYFDQGTMRRRMKQFETYGVKHFNGVHWYPIIAVFDKKFSWNSNHQHLDKEFYADFGTFDVKLTFPQEYVLEATGTLQNRKEVLPDTLYQKLRVENFKDKPFGEKPSIITPRVEGKTKTWHFYAENVHNMAFTASPLYRIGKVKMDGIEIISMVQEPHASRWQPSASFTAKVVEVYDRDFGDYIWPKVIVSDAADGMEYPMITLDGGTYPSHVSLLAHEVGHMWFYGMIGSNEQYRACMDEGFTQFLTVYSLEDIFGEVRGNGYEKGLLKKHKMLHRDRYYRVYYPYMKTVWEGMDYPLNTHSSDFRGAIRQGGGYGLVYFKTAAMLYNLQYFLGDEVFQKAMKHYFNKWKIAHPYPEDFRNAITEYTQTDLTWFFDQWMETTKKIDYSIQSVKQKKESGSFQYTVKLKRKGEMEMPLDIQVTLVGGGVLDLYISNRSYRKETEAQVLKQWYGWGKLHPEYSFQFTTDHPIEKITIDPTNRLADIDMSDNIWEKAMGFTFDHRVKNTPDWYSKKKYIRPDAWYNVYDGLQLGVKMHGNYFKQDRWWDFGVMGHTRLGQHSIAEASKTNNAPASAHFSFRRKLDKSLNKTFILGKASYNVGLITGKLGLEKHFRKQDYFNRNYTKVEANINYLRRDRQEDLLYAIYPNHWSVMQDNSFANISVKRYYNKHGWDGLASFGVRSPFVESDFNYSFLELESVVSRKLHKLVLKTRIYARKGFGNTPKESGLYLAGANPEGLMENRFTQAKAFFPDEWMYYGNGLTSFQQGGGLNLRGFAGFLMQEGGVGMHAANTGAAFNAELSFDDYLPFRVRQWKKNIDFDLYGFADMGSIAYQIRPDVEQWSGVQFDAGLGAVANIKPGGNHFDITPIRIRFDMPLYINSTLPDGNEAGYRYVIGIGRAF